MALVKLSDELRECFVKLTDAEVAKYALLAAQGTLDIGELEDKKKSAASGYKDGIDRKTSEVREFSRKVKDREEMRKVRCTWHADYEARKAYLTRDDTGEEISGRPLTTQEMQGALPLKKATAK